MFGALHGSAEGGGASDQVVLELDLAELYGGVDVEGAAPADAEDGLKDQVELVPIPRLEKPASPWPPPPPDPLPPVPAGGGDDLVELLPFGPLLA